MSDIEEILRPLLNGDPEHDEELCRAMNMMEEYVHVSFAETYLAKLERGAWWLGCCVYVAVFLVGVGIGWAW